MMRSMQHSSRGQVSNGRLPIDAMIGAGRWLSSCHGIGISDLGCLNEEAALIEGAGRPIKVSGHVSDRAPSAVPRRQMRFHMANLMLEIEALDRS